MGLQPGERLRDKPVQVVFIGSCTNARLSDLQLAAASCAGRRIAPGVRMLVVPGSQRSSARPKRLGLAQMFIDAGAEWRESGCSMCLGMNGDPVAAGQYCVSTSNRNFEGRQGKGARTLLASPRRSGGGRCAADHRSARVPALRQRPMEPVTSSVPRPSSSGDQHRYRPDHPGALSHHDHTRWAGCGAVRRLALYDTDGGAARLRAQPASGAAAAEILVAGRNFGCGSSREHAPWALLDFGFRAVISTELADIFRSNSLKNGLLPIVVDEATHRWLLAHPGAEVEIDLPATELHQAARRHCRTVSDRGFARHCLMHGIDELGYLLTPGARDRA